MQPAFVTQIVGKLEQDGLIERSGPKTRPVFRWVKDRGQFSATAWTDRKIYNNRVTRAPRDERPRERLLGDGPCSLSDAELLAIFLRTGVPGKSAVDLARSAGRPFPRYRPVRGEYLVLDREAGRLLPMPLYPLPPASGRSLGIHLTPTIDGTVLVGPSAEAIRLI